MYNLDSSCTYGTSRLLRVVFGNRSRQDTGSRPEHVFCWNWVDPKLHLRTSIKTPQVPYSTSLGPTRAFSNAFSFIAPDRCRPARKLLQETFYCKCHA